MKKVVLKPIAALCAASLLTMSTFAAGSGTGNAVYKDSTVLANGFTYENAISYNVTGSRVETNVIDLSADSAVFPISLACDTIYGGLTITQMIAYAESLGYNVLGAVNTDFCYTATHIPCGMVVEDGVYKCSSDLTNALAISEETAFAVENPTVKITLENQTAERAGQSVSTMHLNKTRDESGLFLYSEHFSTVSTRTKTDGWMVKMKILEGELTVQGEMLLEVTELFEGDKAQKIGEGYLILTADAKAQLGTEFTKFDVGDTVKLTTECSDERLAEAEWVTGCGDILVREDQITEKNWNSALQGYNPRTAVGIRDDGSMVFLTVDGRSKLSAGATMLQLAEDLIEMGCTTVVNMDGGGSTAMALRNGQTGEHEIINIPSDGGLRRCATYILFVTEKGEEADKLFLAEDGQYILAGATTVLSAYRADGALRPLSTGQITFTPKWGAQRGVRYTAPLSPCIDVVSLSSADSSGQGELHIVDKADTLIIRNAETGTEIKSLSLKAGESLKLSVSASKHGRSVYIMGTEILYSCSEGIGSIADTGTFTANGSVSQGSIMVEAAGITASIPVSLSFIFSDINTHWARSSIEALYEKGIVSGTGAGGFSPDADMKRGDFILMLYRACGNPKTDSELTYTDVSPDSYYAKAISWAQQSGIAFGNGDGTFSPQTTLTREQTFTFVYRALGQLKINSPEPDTSLLAEFSDGDSVAEYARNAVSVLIELGVVSGSDGKLAPQATLTRAQMARVLYACLQK